MVLIVTNWPTNLVISRVLDHSKLGVSRFWAIITHLHMLEVASQAFVRVPWLLPWIGGKEGPAMKISGSGTTRSRSVCQMVPACACYDLSCAGKWGLRQVVFGDPQALTAVTKAPSIKGSPRAHWRLAFLAATGGWLARKLCLYSFPMRTSKCRVLHNLSLIACRMWQCSRSHVLSHHLRKAIMLKGYQSSLCYLCCEYPQHLVNLCARKSSYDCGRCGKQCCCFVLSAHHQGISSLGQRMTKEQNSEKSGSRWWLVGISKGYVWSTMKNNAVNDNQTQTIIM